MPAGMVGSFSLLDAGEGHYIISDLLRGPVNWEIGNLGGWPCSSSLCGPQFPYLFREGLDILFATLAFPGCQIASWKSELVL